VEIPADVRSYLDEKVQRLPRFYDRIHEVEFIFDHESDQLTAECIVRADHKQTFVAREMGPEAVALIDLVVEKLERQLRRHKEKQRGHKHDGKREAEGGTS
jgi:putative sigma-54 modulation protein